MIADTELGALVFSYIYKNKRNGISYIIYKDSNQQLQVVPEKNLINLPSNSIGVIDDGIFLPLIKL